MKRNLNKYEKFIEDKQAECGDRFDASQIDLHFVSCFVAGYVARIRFAAGIYREGKLCISNSHQPAFGLLAITDMGYECYSPLIGQKIVAVNRGIGWEATDYATPAEAVQS